MKTVAGFNNSMFPGASMAIGRGAAAGNGTGEISLSGNGINICLLNGAVIVDGDSGPSDEHLFTSLKKLLGEGPERLELVTSENSLVIHSSGDTFVNGRRIGSEPTMLTRALFYVSTVMLPTFNSWLPLVSVEKDR